MRNKAQMAIKHPLMSVKLRYIATNRTRVVKSNVEGGPIVFGSYNDPI